MDTGVKQRASPSPSPQPSTRSPPQPATLNSPQNRGVEPRLANFGMQEVESVQRRPSQERSLDSVTGGRPIQGSASPTGSVSLRHDQAKLSQRPGQDGTMGRPMGEALNRLSSSPTGSMHLRQDQAQRPGQDGMKDSMGRPMARLGQGPDRGLRQDQAGQQRTGPPPGAPRSSMGSTGLGATGSASTRGDARGGLGAAPPQLQRGNNPPPSNMTPLSGAGGVRRPAASPGASPQPKPVSPASTSPQMQGVRPQMTAGTRLSSSPRPTPQAGGPRPGLMAPAGGGYARR